ncbi:RING-H2 finger protein ATL70-like [Salvia hispanica]|uniref:RING-H2 finger protein ATL70-like n=1 Tax=Salvia hispanica TaxID=49212 RepID=UPI0020099259|nr:RING-H2 finger protein ATL70-like [Salvia hispanica]
MSNTAATDDSDSPIGDTALGGFGYGVGLSVAVLAIFVVITYFSYKCKKSPPPNSLSFSSSSSFRSRYFAGDHGAGAPVQVVVRSDGLDAAAISAIPLYTYGGAGAGAAAAGGCAVCLGDYKEGEEVRLMPECGHVFHRSCIDPWLMIHPTCPVCRSTPVVAVAAVEQPATVANQ